MKTIKDIVNDEKAFGITVLVGSALAIGIMVATGASLFNAHAVEFEKMNTDTVVQPKPLKSTENKQTDTVSKPKATNPTVESSQATQYTAPAQEVQPSEPVPETKPKKQQAERIPFTNKDVTAGEPESYQGTYGQCPFYENAMDGKGCVPPPDIKCNEDWSKCEYVGERYE